MDVPAPTVSILSSATAFAKTAVANIPDVAPTINDLQEIARDEGRGIHTATNTVYATGQAVGGTMVQVGGCATRTVGMGVSQSAQTVNTGIQSSTQVLSKGASMVSGSLSSVTPAATSSDIKQPELTRDDIKGSVTSKDDDIGMFNASFSAMPLSMIEEAEDDDDDDDDHGLLHSHHKGRNDFQHHTFDGRSFQNDDDNDNDDDSIGLRSMNSNRRSFKMGKLKGPKLGISLKKLVPKLPKRNQNETTSRGGFLLGGGSNNNGYDGMAL